MNPRTNDKKMNLRILLPFCVFASKTGVSRIVAETEAGSYGLLPQRLDCVAPLVPGVLTYESDSEGEVFIAIDEGMLVKTGQDVLVFVRRAIAATGSDSLGELRASVEQEFLTLDEQEREVRVAMAKLESGFLRRFVSLVRD